jgi:phage terminase large subunit
MRPRAANLSNLVLPYKWLPRPYQLPIFKHMFGDLSSPAWPYRKRAAEVWHRRAGKDSTAANVVAVASQMRVGTYWHMLPTLNQGRKVVWERINSDGTLMIDQAFPEEMRAGINHTDMQIKMLNGSVYQIVGSDNFDSLIGANPIGVIFSEWSVADPRSWDFIRPNLAEN